MDKTLEVLIECTNKILDTPIIISKDQTLISNRIYIMSKQNISIPCKNKKQLIIDLVHEIYNQGKSKKQQEFKQIIGI